MCNDGFFGDLFDLDFDGKLDSFEKVLDTAALLELMENEESDADADAY